MLIGFARVSSRSTALATASESASTRSSIGFGSFALRARSAHVVAARSFCPAISYSSAARS
ncbi:MAG: hypothetical protein IPF99_14230 [Deltaproteobacteria bacterium]|nr:hypothetical protein [Deltaproteobacteria bacterium]